MSPSASEVVAAVATGRVVMPVLALVLVPVAGGPVVVFDVGSQPVPARLLDDAEVAPLVAVPKHLQKTV